MRKLGKVHKMVMYELVNHPKTRNSDKELVIQLYRDYYGLSTQSFVEVMRNSELPSIETIGRVRRKIQEMNVELRAIPEIEKERIAIQQEFIDYALEV